MSEKFVGEALLTRLALQEAARLEVNKSADEKVDLLWQRNRELLERNG